MHINTIDEFEELVKNYKLPLLIIFETSWSPLTKKIREEIERLYKKINIIIMDVSNCPEVCAMLGVGCNGWVLFINTIPVNRGLDLTERNILWLERFGDRSDVKCINNYSDNNIISSNLFAH